MTDLTTRCADHERRCADLESRSGAGRHRRAAEIKRAWKGAVTVIHGDPSVDYEVGMDSAGRVFISAKSPPSAVKIKRVRL